MRRTISGGPTASARVAADPFWSVVRRRHPDLDLVLLPPDEPAAGTSDAPVDTAADAAERLDTDAASSWSALVGATPTATSARWVSHGSGLWRRETTLHLDGTDPVAATAALDGAPAVLRDGGWRVVAPPDGVPRVLAGRDGAELQLVLAPDGRLVLRSRSSVVRLLEAPLRSSISRFRGDPG